MKISSATCFTILSSTEPALDLQIWIELNQMEASLKRISLRWVAVYHVSWFLARNCLFMYLFQKLSFTQAWSEKSKPYSVHLSPKITVVPSSFSTFKMPARGVPSRQYPLAWERATSDYVDISLRRNLCKGHFLCHCDRNYQNSPLQFIRRAHLI